MSSREKLPGQGQTSVRRVKGPAATQPTQGGPATSLLTLSDTHELSMPSSCEKHLFYDSIYTAPDHK